MGIPFLFDANRLYKKELPVFKAQAFINCGRYLSGYRKFKTVPEEVKEVLASSRPELRDAWINEFAAEALVAEMALSKNGTYFPFHEVDPDARPCGASSPTYKVLAGKPHSLSLFPIADEVSHATQPSIGRIWLFYGLKHDSNAIQLDGYDVFSLCLGKHHQIFADFTSEVNPKGRSWELGGTIAFSFIDDPICSFNLATNWIASGSLEGDQVRRVGLLNKLVIEGDNRFWLLPATNKADIGDNYNHLNIRYATLISDAKLTVRGTVIESSLNDKPENPRSLSFNELNTEKNKIEDIKMENTDSPVSDKTESDNPNESDKDKLKTVIRLTDRRPIKILESNWPIIMKANYVIGHIQKDVSVRVKKDKNASYNLSYIVQGSILEREYSQDPEDYQYDEKSNVGFVDKYYDTIEYFGEYIPRANLVVGEHRSACLFEAILKMAKTLGLKEQKLISDLMNSQEPQDLD